MNSKRSDRRRVRIRSFVKRAQKGAVNIARILTQGTCPALPCLRRQRASGGLDASHETYAYAGVPMHRGNSVETDCALRRSELGVGDHSIRRWGLRLGYARVPYLWESLPSVAHPSKTTRNEVQFAPLDVVRLKR